MKKRSRSVKPDSEESASEIRLQKLLASHGHGSRRACEQFILEGRVEVDGKVVNKLGTKVDPDKQKITIDGERLVEQRLQYFMLNKPPGVVSTANDPSGRLRVIDLIKTNSRVYNVGRLDKSSEGLILVTNDGDLANKLTHPRYGIEKKYHVLVKGKPDREQLESLKKGIYLAEAHVQVSNVRVKKRLRDRTWLEIVLDEGRNREIRRILARVGHKVLQLRRVAIGPLVLGDLPLGSHRQLTLIEVKRLKKASSRKGARFSPVGKPPVGKSPVGKPPVGKSFAGKKKSKTLSSKNSKRRETKSGQAKPGTRQTGTRQRAESPSSRPSRTKKVTRTKRGDFSVKNARRSAKPTKRTRQ